MTWEEVTAMSTLGLAVVTWRLAHSTRKLAREANAETRANWRPILMPKTEADHTRQATAGLSLDDRVLSMAIRNVGRGPALMVTAALWTDGEETRANRVFYGEAVSDVAAPDEVLTLEWRDFDAPKMDQSFGIHAWEQLEGKITYGDAAYVRYDTEIKVGFRIDGAVALIDARFLGAARDRMTRRERASYRVLRWVSDLEGHVPRWVLRWVNRVVREAATRRA